VDVIAGVGFGWVANIGASDQVRMWLSPTTAVGMTVARVSRLLGLGEHAAGEVGFVRRVGTAATFLVVAWLLATWRRRSVARNVGLSLVAIAVLAPTMQPWYLLWGLVVLAGAGLRAAELRAAVLVTTVLVLYTVTNTNAMAVSRLALRDGPAAALSVGLVLTLVLASRRARTELLAH
jgi:hypothetical protein